MPTMEQRAIATARSSVCLACPWRLQATTGLWCGPPRELSEGRGVGKGVELMGKADGPMFVGSDAWCPQGKWNGLIPVDMAARETEAQTRGKNSIRATLKPFILMTLAAVKGMNPLRAEQVLLEMVKQGFPEWLAIEIAAEIQLP